MKKNLFKFGCLCVALTLYLNSCSNANDVILVSGPTGKYNVFESINGVPQTVSYISVTFNPDSSQSRTGTYYSDNYFMDQGKYTIDNKFTSLKMIPNNTFLAKYPELDLTIKTTSGNTAFTGTDKNTGETFSFNK